MSFEEKNTWIFAATTLISFTIYLFVLLGRAQDLPLAEVPYIAAMLWAVGGAILATIVGRIVTSIVWPREAGKLDVRDKQIERFGTHTGHAFVVIGALAALVLAMFEADHFWIANAVYLCFVLSGLLDSTARLFAYRRGFQPW